MFLRVTTLILGILLITKEVSSTYSLRNVDAETKGLLNRMQTQIPFLQRLIGFKPPLEIRSFENWGQTVSIPYVFYVAPTQLEHVQRIVKVAGILGFGIRATGGGHSWSPLFADPGQILIDTKSLRRRDGPQMELKEDIKNGGHTVTVAPGVIIADLADYLIENNVELRSWPAISSAPWTIGGATSTATHGASYDEPELSSYVVAVRIIDGRGRLRRFNNHDHPEVMRALRSAVGMCGIIYELTLKVYPLSVVKFSREEVVAGDILRPAKLKELITGNGYVQMKYLPFTSMTKEEKLSFIKNGKAPSTWDPLNDIMMIERVNNESFPGPIQPFVYPPSPLSDPPTNMDIIEANTNILNSVNQLPNVSYHYLPNAIMNIQLTTAAVDTEFRVYDTNDFTASSRAIKLGISKLGREALVNGNIPVWFLLIRWMKNSDCLLCPAGIQNEGCIGPDSSGHTVAIDYIAKDLSPMYKRFVSDVAVDLYPMKIRFHLGKLHEFLPGVRQHLGRVYHSSFAQFRRVSDHLDPRKTFVNRWLRELIYRDVPSYYRHY